MISKLLAKASVVPKQRAPFKTPEDYGLSYESVSFVTDDDVTIKAWYIPSHLDRLIIFTHPMPFNRYGFHTKGQGIMKISDIEVELLEVVKQLNKAGYHVLTMDLRNHGESDKAHNGVCSIGYNEWRDVVAAKEFINQHEQLSKLTLGMVVNCLGANSALIAMAKKTELFNDIKAIVAIQPVSYDVFLKNYLRSEIPLLKGLEKNIHSQIKMLAGVGPDQMSPLTYVDQITAPIMYVQVKNDAWTDPSDITNIYEQTKSEKELLWLEGDLHRFDGYNYFGQHPEKMISWLNQYMSI